MRSSDTIIIAWFIGFYAAPVVATACGVGLCGRLIRTSGHPIVRTVFRTLWQMCPPLLFMCGYHFGISVAHMEDVKSCGTAGLEDLARIILVYLFTAYLFGALTIINYPICWLQHRRAARAEGRHSRTFPYVIYGLYSTVFAAFCIVSRCADVISLLFSKWDGM